MENAACKKLEAVYRGNIDSCDLHRILGWAWDSSNPHIPLSVDIYDNGRLVNSVTANLHGADLQFAGIGNGCHRFAFEISSLISDGELHTFNIRYGGTQQELPGSPKRISTAIKSILGDLEIKEFLALKYLLGNGIEIGALHNPLRVGERAKVQYVDRMSVADLKKHYPELRAYPLVDVDIVDNGEALFSIPQESQDFVIANHFLEHCQDPIGTIKNMYRVLKHGGILFITVPNKRTTLDKDRAAVDMDHLIADHLSGPAQSRMAHYQEWARLVEKIEDPVASEKRAEELARSDYSIHFHCFSELEIVEFIVIIAKQFSLPLRLEHLVNNGNHEVVFIVRKE